YRAPPPPTRRCRAAVDRAGRGPRHRGLPRHRARHSLPVRPARRPDGCDRLSAQRPRRRGRRRRAPPARSGAGARARQRLVHARRRTGRGARAARRGRPQRGDRGDPPRARDHGQALRLDARRQRPRVPLARPRGRPADAARLVDRRRLQPRLGAGARGLRARRDVESRARGARPLPRGRARAARDPRERRLRRPRRHRGARALPEPRAHAVLESRADAGRTVGGAGGGRRRGRLPLLAPGGDDPRPDPGRRRRLLARRLGPRNTVLQGPGSAPAGRPATSNTVLQGSMWPTEQNRQAWDERYGGRREPPARLPDAVRQRLPDLRGKHVLHLPSRSGEVAAELMELGALVTGVDADERALDAAFFQAEPHELPLQFRRGRFGVVYAGEGTLEAVDDLAPLASGLAAALRTNGRLLLYDRHPVAGCVDPVDLRWRESYFEEGIWGLGQIAVAVVETGLQLATLAELPPPTAETGGRLDPRIPAYFLLVADRVGRPATAAKQRR